MTKIELPEMPPVLAHMHSTGEVCADRMPEPPVLWPVDLVAANNLRARDRQIVELCAQVCRQLSHSEYDGAAECVAAILALLGDQHG